MAERRFWLGVVSREHVRQAVAGGFAQLSHGKRTVLARMTPGDRLVYYSPRQGIDDGERLQRFTAIGEVVGELRQVVQAADFQPFRRDVRYFAGDEAAIAPLLEQLSFTAGRGGQWGIAMRRGAFAIERDDYRAIARAMGVADDV